MADPEQITRLFEQLPSLVGRDADLVRRGRFLTCDFELGIGALPLLVSVGAGEIKSVSRGPFLLLHRPDVHGGEVCAGLVSGMMAPQSPSESRHETLWMYKSGGPGVFKGDLYFYRVDGDLRDKISRIDTSLCPLYLLTGEYDFSCTPEDTLRTAAKIKGVDVTIMQELGHFPMSENPTQFRRYILPVLEKIKALPQRA